MSVQLNDDKDVFVWGLTPSGVFVKSMYLDLLDNYTKYLKKYIWKMKVPLKMKIFMWFLHWKVILTKDNLIKRQWTGNKNCCFCDNNESIQHLFFVCLLSKVIWRIIYMTFGLAQPKNVTNLFGNWLKGISKKDLIQIRVGVCAMIWALWNTRNDYVFNRPEKLFLAGYSYGYPESICGLTSNKRSSRRRWILGATMWRR
jgi:hypothetical protein